MLTAIYTPATSAIELFFDQYPCIAGVDEVRFHPYDSCHGFSTLFRQSVWQEGLFYGKDTFKLDQPLDVGLCHSWWCLLKLRHVDPTILAGSFLSSDPTCCPLSEINRITLLKVQNVTPGGEIVLSGPMYHHHSFGTRGDTNILSQSRPWAEVEHAPWFAENSFPSSSDILLNLSLFELFLPLLCDNTSLLAH
ncbi:unnamed protein product [Phytomonas sp. EM1]|nr:unnamed protein product [Phytomonas sp. EM1]|eukprot:CCW65801.1 unnamed protein product [Phytomonas sp. isolate EM1]